jgi:molybdenum cofactor cytidylyltransferase
MSSMSTDRGARGDSPRLGVILLAAGESTRMGRLKALLPWGKAGTLLEYHLEQLSRSRATDIVLVLGHQADELCPLAARFPQVRAVINERYSEGRASSIRAGALALPEGVRAVAVVAVDQPCPASLLDFLFEEHLHRDALITIPAYQGQRGHPPIFDGTLLPELRAVDDATEGLREVRRRYADSIRLVETGSPFVLLNLNRPEDYQQALELAARAP